MEESKKGKSSSLVEEIEKEGKLTKSMASNQDQLQRKPSNVSSAK